MTLYELEDLVNSYKKCLLAEIIQLIILHLFLQENDDNIMNKLTSTSSSRPNVPMSEIGLSKPIEKVLVKNESLPNEISRSNATFPWTSQINQNTITTGFYIVAALSTIIVLYFVLRAIR